MKKMFGPAHNSAEQVPKRFIRHGLIVDDLYGEREPEDESVGALAFLGRTAAISDLMHVFPRPWRRYRANPPLFRLG